MNRVADALVIDSDHCKNIFCLCGFMGEGFPMRRHIGCPRCYRVVEVCYEGVPEYYKISRWILII